MTKTTILLATNNPGKRDQLIQLFSGLPFHVLTPADINLDLEPDETGSTYAENAILKARAFSRATGLAALADDSGLEVEALGGAPGIRSSRYLPQEGANDRDRYLHIVELLRPHPRPWTAQFQSVVAVFLPGEPVLLGHGTVKGEIIPEPRGRWGFGYDPVFMLPSGRTFAEIPPKEKNEISHRTMALKDLLPRLLSKLSSSG